MSDLRQAAQQALDFIVATNKSSQFWLVPGSNLNKTVTALRAALSEPETKFPEWQRGCRVCGIGADGKAYGYVCPRLDCPTRVTCGGVA